MKHYKTVGDHVLYGTSDTAPMTEVLVYYHPNGTNCTVFLLGGNTGGVGRYSEDLLAHTVDSLWAESKYDGDFYDAIESLILK